MLPNAVHNEAMSLEKKLALEELCAAFATRPGKLALIVQSKSDPDFSAAINAHMTLPSASVIKPAIACAASDLATRGGLELHRTRAKAELDETFYCSILEAFDGADRLTLKALIGLMLIVSDNPATSAVLDAVGMDRVNTWLDANGLDQTSIEVGFADASLGALLRANLTTAKDCLRLLQLIDTTPAYAFIKRMLANNLRNERIPKRLPDDAVIAHKTGTLVGLAHDIAIVESPIAAYYMIVLADALDDEAAFVSELAVFSERVYGLMRHRDA